MFNAHPTKIESKITHLLAILSVLTLFEVRICDGVMRKVERYPGSMETP